MTQQKPATARDPKTILRALGPHDRARQLTLARFKELGGSLERLKSRRDREHMADALTYAEDRIEFAVDGKVRPFDKSADRQDLRVVRRQLEWELWP